MSEHTKYIQGKQNEVSGCQKYQVALLVIYEKLDCVEIKVWFFSFISISYATKTCLIAHFQIVKLPSGFLDFNAIN